MDFGHDQYIAYNEKLSQLCGYEHYACVYFSSVYQIYSGKQRFSLPNWPVYYLCVFGFASLCVVVFSSPPVAKIYDGILDKLYEFYLWVKGKVILPKA